MSKYSSDSDSSSKHRKSRRRRSRSTSSSSSGHRRRSKKSSRNRSSSRYTKSSTGHRRRSRRRSSSRSNTNSRNSRSLSKDRRRRSYSRDRYKNRYHHKSRSDSKGLSSRYYSRSSSNETRSRQSKSPVRSNSSSSSSSKKAVPTANTATSSNLEDQLKEKLMKAIKAAESADHQLKQQGVLAKCVKSRNDLTSFTTGKPQSEIVKGIEKDEFIQKSFTSSKSKKISVEEVSSLTTFSDPNQIPEVAVNSIFHTSFFCDPKTKLDRWVKKLYQIRQRAIAGEPLGS